MSSPSDPEAHDPSAFDPSAHDPSAHDPSAADPASPGSSPYEAAGAGPVPPPPGYQSGYPAGSPPMNPGGYPAVMQPAPPANCQYCGAGLPPNAAYCVSCQAPVVYVPGAMVSSKDKTAAGLLGIFLGGLGIHKFYLGYNAAGGIMLGITIAGFCLTFVLIGVLFVWVPSLIGFIEGIIYLTKSDAEFQQTYVLNKKEWF